MGTATHPIITLLEDTSPGVHDTLVAACDIYRYRNCTDNLWNTLKALGLTAPETPCPFNLFQNTQYVTGKGIQYLPTVSKPGQYVVFRAEMDAVVVFSACPQDMLPVNSGMSTKRTSSCYEIKRADHPVSCPGDPMTKSRHTGEDLIRRLRPDERLGDGVKVPIGAPPNPWPADRKRTRGEERVGEHRERSKRSPTG